MDKNTYDSYTINVRMEGDDSDPGEWLDQAIEKLVKEFEREFPDADVEVSNTSTTYEYRTKRD